MSRWRSWLTRHKVLAGFNAILLVVAIVVAYNVQSGNLKPGIGPDKTVTRSTKKDKQGNTVETIRTVTFQDEKTLWDWLGLVVVPLTLLGLGAILEELQQSRADREAQAEQEIAELDQREEILQNYIDRLSELLIDKSLIATDFELQPTTQAQATLKQQELLNAAKNVIRARTLSILRRLGTDGDRKGDVIRFLIDTGIVSKLDLNLSGAKLSNAKLRGAKLRGAKLRDADLTGADLIGADFSTVDFNIADFSGANLTCVDFTKATLILVNLSGANLDCTNLSRANLSGARNWTEEQLAQALLCQTQLPPEANLNPNRDCQKLGISID
jgi:uncharacterized protein YjbI with pentapeptide repeats